MIKTKMPSQGNTFDIAFKELEKADFVLRALNHKIRQQILHLIQKNGEMTVSEIYAKLKLEQSRTSTYLAILRKAGIVNTRREGQCIFYFVNHKRIALIEKGAKIINGHNV